MAFPTTGILDTFDRANEGPPPSANWSNGILNSGSDGLKVVSNTVRANIANSSGWWNVGTFGPDSEAYVTVTTRGSGETNLYARLSSPGVVGSVDGYLINNNVFFNQTKFFRYDDSAATQLGATESSAIADGNSWGLEVIGDDLGYYLNTGSWSLIASRTDATYSSAGFIGLRMDSTTQADDNFGGGTVSAGVDTGLAWITA